MRCFYLANDDLWCYEVFLTLAQRPAIDDLRLRILSQPYLEKLKEDCAIPFQRLKKLNTSLTEETLTIIVSLVSQLTTLNVTLLGNSSSTLKVISSLCQLERLHLEFNDQLDIDPNIPFAFSIHGEDLLLIAGHCKNLRRIKIGTYHEGPHPIGISDLTIQTFSQLMPELEEFELYLRDSQLTEESISSLGKHCKKLNVLELTGRVDFFELARLQPHNLFPALEVLRIDQRIHFNIDWISAKEVESLSYKILEIMPKCTCFHSGYHHFPDSATNRLDVLTQQNAIERLLSEDGYRE